MTPWMTRKEAAEYLCTSVDSVDRRLVLMGHVRVAGQIRYTKMQWEGQSSIRILREDVFAILPPPNLKEDRSIELEVRS